MGAAISLLSVACCATSAACSLCPNTAHSTVSKLMYALILLATLVVSCLMLTPGVESWLTRVPFCAESAGLVSTVAKYLPGGVGDRVQVQCANAVGYLAVYRVCFVVTLFFAFMALIMTGVRSSRDPRAPIQNGVWGLKFLVIIVGVVAAFFIPHGGFGHFWMIVGMGGGMAFVLVQLVLIIDFAHSW